MYLKRVHLIERRLVEEGACVVDVNSRLQERLTRRHQRLQTVLPGAVQHVQHAVPIKLQTVRVYVSGEKRRPI